MDNQNLPSLDNEDKKVACVVCGMEKPRSQMPFSSDFGGKFHFFCSKIDKDMFDANPDKWSGR